MESWRACALLLLVAPALAGCLGGEDDPLSSAIVDDDAAAPTVPEGRGPILAFEETNRTEEGVDGLEHHHDYWQGRDRVRLLEKDAMLPVTDESETSAAVRPAQGDLVFEGTASLEVVVSDPRHQGLVPAAAPPALELSYRHAAATDWISVGPVAWGETMPIQVTNPAQTDMPHATWSLWEFRLLSRDPAAQTLLVAVAVDILRGEGEIPLWPGHPEFYAESSQRVVADADAVAGDNGLVGRVSPIDESGDPVRPERVISYGTRTLHVFVNVSSFEVTNPLDQPTNFWLRYHNASGAWTYTNLFDKENHSSESKEHVWVLKVNDDGMDSPYADGSRWGFQLGAAFTQGVPGALQVSCYGGCATWRAEYHVTILATDEALPDEAYA